MKDNNIPRKERIERRIANLKRKVSEPWEPIGHGNPYSRCIGCGISRPENKHWKGCWVRGIEKQIDYYEGLLYEESIKNRGVIQLVECDTLTVGVRSSSLLSP